MEEVRVHRVECPHYREHGHRPGREVETISFTCEEKGRHISPWVDCVECGRVETRAIDERLHR